MVNKNDKVVEFSEDIDMESEATPIVDKEFQGVVEELLIPDEITPLKEDKVIINIYNCNCDCKK